jgi:hypothetical protein
MGMYVLTMGSGSGQTTTTSAQYVGFQNYYESGACTTPEGVACYVADISRAFWSRQQTSACSFAEAVMGNCDGANAGLGGRSGAGWAGIAAATLQAAIRAVGLYAENAVSGYTGLARNTGPGQFRITNLLSGGNYRIPDFVDTASQRIIEVKYLSAIRLTSQIADMADWATRNAYTFTIYVGQHTQGVEKLKELGIDVVFDYPMMNHHLSSTESAMLEDIHHRTGLAYARAQNAVPRSIAEAKKLLSVLAEWIAKLGDIGERRALYSGFGTKLAHAWIGQMLSWWQHETDAPAKGHLTTIIASIMRDSDARQVWDVMCERDEQYPFDSAMLVRMAVIDDFSSLATQRAIDRLMSGRFTAGDLWQYSKLQDARIGEWLTNNRQHEDPTIQKVVRKILLAKPRDWPPWLKVRRTAPKATIIYSTEVDITKLGETLEELSRRVGFHLPGPVPDSFGFAHLRTNTWLRSAELHRPPDSSPELWIRLEDFDTVEVVLVAGDA